ncbi:MAG: hypothetical protein Kow0088_10040 [Anaerolineales bacterium]
MFLVSIFQEGPAETTAYMIAGYAIIIGVICVYIVSLWLRWRNLHRDQAMLENLLTKEQGKLQSTGE